jgi:hypothetical protein
MGINQFICRGVISSYGWKISWTDSGQLQPSLTLVCEEQGRDGTTFTPVLIVGPLAE